MKRQRNTATATKKKAKGEVEEEEEEEVVEERRDAGEFVEVEANLLKDWDEWPRLWSVADEQMSWGSFWCPFWDMVYLGEAYNELYSDVVWDDDIWDLQGIMEVPNP